MLSVSLLALHTIARIVVSGAWRKESISITSRLDNLCNALWCCSKHLL